MNIIQKMSEMVIPAIIFFVIVSGIYKKKNVFDIFSDGAKEGLKLTFDIFPSIIGLMMAIGMMNACGVIELLVEFLKPILDVVGMPEEVLPLVVLRPVSGSASIGIVGDIFKNCGPDSYAGRVASVMMGSTETTFYTIALFYGTIKQKVSSRVVIAAISGDIAGMLASIIFCRILM